MVAAVAYKIPVFGWMLREAVRGNEFTKVLFVVNMLLLWALSIVAFGYPAIILPALAMVPTMFVILIMITAGK